MKSFRRLRLQRDVMWMFLLFVLTVTAVSPISVSASDNAQTGSVIASAVAVPAQISRMGFMISAPVKEVLVKEGDTVVDGQPLIVLNTPDLEYAVVAADAAYRSAEAYATLQRYKRVKDFRNGSVFWDIVHPEVRQRADALALQAKIAMEIAQAILAQNTIIAPYDGTVADINVIPGEFVAQGQAVIALATLDNLQIETTDLNERDVMKVKVGDKASVKIEALNETFPGDEALNKTFPGKVVGISPKADNRGGDIVFKVTIVLDEQPKGLLWGMTAEVTLGE